jgi:hypothetical protein
MGLNKTLGNPSLLIDATISFPLHLVCANYFLFELIVAMWVKRDRYRKFHINVSNANDIG